MRPTDAATGFAPHHLRLRHAALGAGMTAAAGRKPVSIDPASKSYQRLARRIAVNSLRGAVKAVCRLGDVKDIRESSFLVAGVLARVNAKGGSK